MYLFIYLFTLGYTLSFRVHVCSSEHSDLSVAYRLMSLIYGLDALTTDVFIYLFIY